ncbi:MAG: hypothetical protein ACXVGN_00340 [Mycobacteriaceae bacterium]
MRLARTPRRPRLSAAVEAVGVGLLIAAGLTVAATPAGASERTGKHIDATNCAYGPGQIVAGHKTGQYFGDSEAFYAGMFLPSGMPGGHFQLTGRYPKASWFNFQTFDDAMGTTGEIHDVQIQPNPGSVNPFRPRQRYQPAHAAYTVNVRDVPPAQRKSGTHVLYGGYRDDPKTGGLIHTHTDFVVYQVLGALDRSQRGGAPLPRLAWVVDNPRTNQLHNKTEVCAAMQAAALPLQPVFRVNKPLDQYIWTPVEEPLLKKVDAPMPFDPVPSRHPFVNVFRPAKNGYWWPLFNQDTPYIETSPSAAFGRFVVIHYKVPTEAHIEHGIPATGDEQTRYWSWCAGQADAAVFITTGCLTGRKAHPDAHGYDTLVISPKNQRPTINGKPYPDWLEWPGAGPFIFMQTPSPNPATFHQSPFFMPPTRLDDVPFLNEYLPGMLLEKQIRSWMGAYYPQVSYCTRARFQAGRCHTPDPTSGIDPSQGASR